MVRFFDIEQEGSSIDFPPWIEDYLDQGGNLQDETPITSFILRPKGIILNGKLFSDMVYKKSRLHEFLIEALEHYVNNPLESPVFIMAIGERNKARVGIIEDSVGLGKWVKHSEKKLYTYVTDRIGKESTTLPHPSNPFLLGSPSLNLTKGGRKKEST